VRVVESCSASEESLTLSRSLSDLLLGLEQLLLSLSLLGTHSERRRRKECVARVARG